MKEYSYNNKEKRLTVISKNEIKEYTGEKAKELYKKVME